MIKFVEFQNFGWNSLTITALVTMGFTVFQAIGVIGQNKVIWKEKSGESLSGTLFFLYLFYFIAFFFYGLNKNSLAMTFNSLLALPYLPIVIGIFKFKKLSKFEKISFPITMSVVPLMILVEQKDILLLCLLLISLLVLTTQPLEMIKTKTRGAVDINFILIFSLSSIFWLIYSLAITNWALIIFNSLALVIYAIIIYLYQKYKLKV